MVIPRRCFPGPPTHARNIKMEPKTSTDAAQERNWAEVDSPVPETTNSDNGREEGKSKISPNLRETRQEE